MGGCLDLLDVQAAELVLVNARGDLELVASTSQGAEFVEVMQLNAGGGPCVECVHTGESVSIVDVEQVQEGWAPFQAAALAQGFHSSHAVPLRIRSQTIGSMGLFRTRTGGLDADDSGIARALADLGSVGILQQRVLRESAMVTEQLQRALDSRVIIEQAKGVIAASADVDMEEAFRLLRGHARDTNGKLHDVAQAVVARPLRIGRSGKPAASQRRR